MTAVASRTPGAVEPNQVAAWETSQNFVRSSPVKTRKCEPCENPADGALRANWHKVVNSVSDGPFRKRRVMRRRRNRISRGLEEFGLLEFAKFEQILGHGPTMNNQTAADGWIDPGEQLGDFWFDLVGLG